MAVEQQEARAIETLKVSHVPVQGVGSGSLAL